MRVKGTGGSKIGRLGGAATAGGVAKARYGATEGTTPASPHDEVALSAVGRLVGIAGEGVAAAPSIRAEVLAPIREALQAGRYDVDSLKVADKMLRQVLLSRRFSR